MTADDLFAVKFDLFTGICRFYDHHDRSRAHEIFWVMNGVFWVDPAKSGVLQRHFAGWLECTGKSGTK